MATAAIRAERIAALSAAGADAKDVEDVTFGDVLVTSVEKALDQIDGDSLLSPADQAGLVVVAIVRGFLPVVRDYVDDEVTRIERTFRAWKAAE